MSYTLEDFFNNRAVVRNQDKEELNDAARYVRSWMKLVKDRGHLQDLYQEFKTRHPKNACEDLWNYYRFIARLAKPQLEPDYFMLAVGFFAPVVERAVVQSMGSAERAERKKLDDKIEEQRRLDEAGRGDIQKIDTGSSQYSVKEIWVASKQEYLEYERSQMYKQYHPSGYGTSCGDIAQQESGEHAGKFACSFYRSTSAD